MACIRNDAVRGAAEDMHIRLALRSLAGKLDDRVEVAKDTTLHVEPIIERLAKERAKKVTNALIRATTDLEVLRRLKHRNANPAIIRMAQIELDRLSPKPRTEDRSALTDTSEPFRAAKVRRILDATDVTEDEIRQVFAICQVDGRISDGQLFYGALKAPACPVDIIRDAADYAAAEEERNAELWARIAAHPHTPHDVLARMIYDGAAWFDRALGHPDCPHDAIRHAIERWPNMNFGPALGNPTLTGELIDLIIDTIVSASDTRRAWMGELFAAAKHPNVQAQTLLRMMGGNIDMRINQHALRAIARSSAADLSVLGDVPLAWIDDTQVRKTTAGENFTSTVLEHIRIDVLAATCSTVEQLEAALHLFNAELGTVADLVSFAADVVGGSPAATVG